MDNLEEKIEEISRERENQLMQKNDQIEEIEALREHDKRKAKEREEQLRTKIRELQKDLDKQSGFDEDNENSTSLHELNEKNDFLIKQAEEFAEELEKTINAEEELSKENIELSHQLNELKAEMEMIKSTTPERFERLVNGFGHERKEFDEIHEKVFDENEQLRKVNFPICLKCCYQRPF
jgi:DNA anti-recombination protein RmuC